MASLSGVYVPTYPGLSAVDLFKPARHGAVFPFDAPSSVTCYRATSAIYHLFRALVAKMGRVVVLVPDYNSGNEVLALKAAGATIRYCPVRRDALLDPEEVEQLCAIHQPDVLFVIHYFGWPQRIAALADICRRRGLLLVEDCALSLLSETDGQPLGTFGDWSVFCLYKTLPVPNGALLVQNGPRLDALEHLKFSDVGPASLAGRAAELIIQRIRSRAGGVGAALDVAKRGMGRAATALDIHRANVGNIGLDPDEMALAMSPISRYVVDRLDLDDIRRRRIANHHRLEQQLPIEVIRLFPDLPEGACPLFFPVLVQDKAAAATALHHAGIGAIELWNTSVDPSLDATGPDARFLREHVVEIPIHQDLLPRHIDHVAQQLSRMVLREAA